LFWIIWRMLRPVYIEPPPQLQIVIHIHSAHILVQTRETGR
jgi:hypothetical protein